MKKFLTLFMSFLLLLPTFSVANAGKAEYYYWINYTEDWELMQVSRTGHTNNGSSWNLLYVGTPSPTGGEHIAVNESFNVALAFGGTLHLPIEIIQPEFDFSLSGGCSVSIDASSRVLTAGEYVVIHYRHYYEKFQVLQALLRDGQGYNLDSEGHATGTIQILNNKVADTDYYYVYKPVAPQLRFTYYDTNSTSPQSSMQARVEIYTYIDGRYVLTRYTAH